jgi:hypothetical protein
VLPPPPEVTVTVADWLVVPPEPVQERVKVVLAVSADEVSEPDVDLVPDQPLLAVQMVALTEDQVMVVVLLEVTVVGEAEIVTVGIEVVAVVTVTVTVLLVIPPEVAVMLVVPAVSGVTTPLKETVATEVLLEFQVRVVVIGLLFWSNLVADMV